MSTKTSSPVRQIDRRILLSIHQDGFTDMVAGLMVADFGLIPVLDATGMGPGLRQLLILFIYALVLLLFIGLKRRITTPRSGYVKLTRARRTRISFILLITNILMFLLVGTLYLFEPLRSGLPEAFRISLPIGILFLTLFTVSGVLLFAPRFYLYGILVLALFMFFEYRFTQGHGTHEGIPAAAFLSGGVVLLSGWVQLIRFLRKYPADNPAG